MKASLCDIRVDDWVKIRFKDGTPVIALVLEIQNHPGDVTLIDTDLGKLHMNTDILEIRRGVIIQ